MSNNKFSLKMKALKNTMYYKDKNHTVGDFKHELYQHSQKPTETITHEELVNIIREAKNKVAIRIFLYGIVIAFVLGGTVISLLTNKIELLLFTPIGLALFVAFITALFLDNFDEEDPRSILENLRVFLYKKPNEKMAKRQP